MEKKIDQPKFETQSTIEQQPFKEPAVQAFFDTWCAKNDSIEPRFIDRQEWEERGLEGSLEEAGIEGHVLYIPKDLQLWEMVGIMELVDHNTFKDDPEKQKEKKEEMMDLGKMFKDSAVYIAQRINSIDQGQHIAKALAEEFFSYGTSILENKKPEDTDLKDIADQTLTPEETQAVDKWLAGDDLYASRMARVEQAGLGERDDLLEQEREKTLSQFFRISQKAFERQREPKDEPPAALEAVKQDEASDQAETKPEETEETKEKEEKKPWQSTTPLYAAFLEKVERRITEAVEAPKRELGSAIFRRGMELLRNTIGFDKALAEEPWLGDIILHWQNGEKTLRESLQVEKLKDQLAEVRQTGDMNQISQAEQNIARMIQEAVSAYPYKGSANNPSEMAATQEINCVGASILGSALMSEVGLNHLVAHVPDHSITFLITSDDKMIWQDMLNSKHNGEMTDKMIYGKRSDGSELTVADIVTFSKDSESEELMFDVVSDEYREKLDWIKKGERQYVIVFTPEIGAEAQVYNNLGNALGGLDRYEEAIEAYKLAIKVASKHPYPYSGMGNVLDRLDRHDEAIEFYRKAIAIAEGAYAYSGLGDALRGLGRYDEAIEAYEKAIAVNTEEFGAYNGLGNVFWELDRHDEAIEFYRKAIAINDKEAVIHYNLGSIFYELGRYEEAADALEQVTIINPKHFKALKLLGDALDETGLYEDALEAYRKVIDLDPEHCSAYIDMGVVLSRLDRREEAIEAYRKAIDIDPNSMLAYYNLGNSYYRLCRDEEAVSVYKKFIDLAEEQGRYDNLIENARETILELEDG